MKSLMKDILGLETAFEINASEDVIQFYLLNISKRINQKRFCIFIQRFLMYLLVYGGSIAIAHWVHEIYQSLTGDDI